MGSEYGLSFKYKKADRPWTPEEQWKNLVKSMWGGQWMTIADIQRILKVRRKRVRLMLKKGIDAGIVERQMIKTFERVKSRRLWYSPEDSPTGKAIYRKTDGFLPRGRNYYRLLMDKVEIEIEKDPSE